MFEVAALAVRFVMLMTTAGQNVNKVSTKAQCSLDLASATWIPVLAREKWTWNEGNRLNKRGEFVYSSDRYRTQAANHQDVVEKMYRDIMEASKLPKEPTGISFTHNQSNNGKR